MTHRISVLLMLAVLLLTASLALAATEAPAVTSAPAAVNAMPVPVAENATSAPAPICSTASTFNFIPSPVPKTDICGGCSEANCLGKPVGAMCPDRRTYCTIVPTCGSSTTACHCLSV